MSLKILINESVSTHDRLSLPQKLIHKLSRAGLALNATAIPLYINVPDSLNTRDNLGTYKPWFNGMKHFDTVKSLPPNTKKTE